MNGNISLLKEDLNHNMTAVVLPVTVFIGVEAIVGLFGNTLILLIYSKRYKQSNFRYIVLSLAIVDLTSCCTTLPGEIFSQLNWYNYKYEWICKVKSYFNIFTAWASASLLLILAFDRYRKICRPLSLQIQPSVALHMCGISFILSAFVSIPVTIFWGKQTYIYEVDGANLTVSVCEKSDQYADGIYPLIYIGSVYMLPVSLMIFVAGSLNFLTAKTLFGRSILEAQTRRLSLSATTLTSLSFERDFNDTEEKLAAEDGRGREKPNGYHKDSQVIKDTCAAGSLREDVSKSVHLTLEDHQKPKKKQDFVHTSNGISSISGTMTDSLDSLTAKVDVRNGNVTCSRKHSTCNSDINDDLRHYETGNSNESDNVHNHTTVTKTHSKSLKSGFHRKQKTIIMLVLTAVFVFTMSTYVILTSFVAKPDGILKLLTNTEKVTFFFFWRLYFVNSVINPILYGFMDPRFRAGLFSFIPGYKIKRRQTKRATQSTFVTTHDVNSTFVTTHDVNRCAVNGS